TLVPLGSAFRIATLSNASVRVGPAVASDGSNFLVAYSNSPERVAATLQAVRIDGAADRLLDPSPLTLSSSPADGPAVTFDGTNYIVAWSDLRNAPFSGADVYAARISPAGSTLDPGGFVVTSAVGDQFSPAAASSGTGSLVVWADTRNE